MQHVIVVVIMVIETVVVYPIQIIVVTTRTIAGVADCTRTIHHLVAVCITEIAIAIGLVANVVQIATAVTRDQRKSGEFKIKREPIETSKFLPLATSR